MGINGMYDQSLLFNKIISDQRVHIRFLHTLSLMELLGAHKLSRLVPYLGHSTAFLEHVAEEFRHAYFLRSLAEKLSKDSPTLLVSAHPLAKRASCNYINHLHRLVCLLLKKVGLYCPSSIKNRAYLLSTLAIETRALPFYQSYQQALSEHGLAISVKSILSEETRHLAEMKAQTVEDQALLPVIDRCLAIEKKLYNHWLASLEAEFLQA